MIHEHKVKGFTGSIKVKMLKFKERLEVIKSLNIVQKDGEVELSDDNVEKFGRMAELVAKQIQEMDLKHKKSNASFSSLEDLEYYAEYTTVVNEIATILLNGVSLGNA